MGWGAKGKDWWCKVIKSRREIWLECRTCGWEMVCDDPALVVELVAEHLSEYVGDRYPNGAHQVEASETMVYGENL